MRYTEGASEWSPGPHVNQVSPHPKSNKGKIAAAIVAGVVLLCCGLSIPVLASMLDQDAPRSSGGQIEIPSPAPRPATMPTPPGKVAPKKVTIGEGQWIVGEDVQPGRYKTPGAIADIFTACIWTVYTSEGGDVVSLGSSGEANAPGRATLKKGQAFHTTGCQPWVRQSS